MKTRYFTTLLFICSVASADDDLHSRFLTEIDGATDIKLAAFVQRGSQIEIIGRPKLEFSVGLLYSGDDERAFLSIGPVWQHLRFTDLGVFIGELSIAPTVLTGGKFRNKDIGGVLHFTTGLGVGWKPTSESSFYVGFRFQHISNGSIRHHNPGINSFGLELIWMPET